MLFEASAGDVHNGLKEVADEFLNSVGRFGGARLLGGILQAVHQFVVVANRVMSIKLIQIVNLFFNQNSPAGVANACVLRFGSLAANQLVVKDVQALPDLSFVFGDAFAHFNQALMAFLAFRTAVQIDRLLYRVHDDGGELLCRTGEALLHNLVGVVDVFLDFAVLHMQIVES